VSRFSEVKCLIKNNDLTFETFLCARLENIHPSAFPKWRIYPINTAITQIDKHTFTLGRFAKFIIAYTSWVVLESVEIKKIQKKNEQNKIKRQTIIWTIFLFPGLKFTERENNHVLKMMCD